MCKSPRLLQLAKTIGLVLVKICGWFIVACVLGLYAQMATANPLVGWFVFVGILGFTAYRTVTGAYRRLTEARAEQKSAAILTTALTPDPSDAEHPLIDYDNKTEPPRQ
jgi:hypothetical protein